MNSLWKRYAFVILIAYLGVGFFLFPVIGSVAIVCMLAPVVMAFTGGGRKWCGLYCPRGSFWDNVMTKLNSRKTIPGWARAKGFRVFMVMVIFTVFGWQMVSAWPNPDQIGLVFLRIIFVTTLVGIVLGLVYSPRTWCSFCPMGTLAAWVSAWKKSNPLNIKPSCMSCGLCAKACPMQLTPYKEPIFSEPDCLKCGECVAACPKKAIEFQNGPASCNLDDIRHR